MPHSAFGLIINGVNPRKPIPPGMGHCGHCFRKNYGSKKDARRVGRTQRAFWNVHVWRCSGGYWHHNNRRDGARARSFLRREA